MRLIYTALIESRLVYVIVLWGSASRTSLLRVFLLQQRAICRLAGIKKTRNIDFSLNNFKY